MADDDPALLYWLALNRLPWAPARVRRLHLATGSEGALAALGPGELKAAGGREAESRGTPEAGPLRTGSPGSGSPAAPGTSAPGEADSPLWKQVVAGAVGAAAPFEDLEGLSGEVLLEGAQRERERARALGLELISLPDPRYPFLLSRISSPPPVLYAAGRMEILFESRRANPAGWWDEGDAGNWVLLPDSPPRPVCLAVVGSRSASEYGLAMARRIGRSLARAGAAVVSGLALGIDAEAHLGALEAGGPTVAVLGGGLADVGEPGGGLAASACPGANRRLFRRILDEGLVISEYPLGTPPMPQHFPRRNRIIAGLCPAVTLVEAASRSGALTTARLALEEGREVFAVPGRLTTPTASGCNGLIRSGAAQLLLEPGQILDELPEWWRAAIPRGGDGSADPARRTEGLDPPNSVEARVLEAIARSDSAGLDRILASAGATSSETLAALLSLELRGLVRAVPGGRYRLEEGGPGAVPDAGEGT